MHVDDAFDDLIESLGGFHRTWLAYLGLELGMFEALRTAGADGLTPASLAAATGTTAEAAETWAWAADAHGLADLTDDGRLVEVDAMTAVLLDADRLEYLGGQVAHAAVASLDWAAMPEFLRTGRPLATRPERYRASIERLTRQDIAVFFQEALAAVPQLVVELEAAGRVLDVHCGGALWLVAVAKRFPGIRGVGVEAEEDSLARAARNIASAGVADRVAVRAGGIAAAADAGPFDLAYYQYALHTFADPAASLREAAALVRPGGHVVVLDWPLPSTADEFRSRHGELIAGVQLDAMLEGRRLAPREAFVGWFEGAGLRQPTVVDLPSGATLFVTDVPAGGSAAA